MIKRLLLILPLVALGLLAGCATMTPQECKGADWRAIGLRDGQAGETMDMMDRRNKDCAEAGVAVNTPIYVEGRNQGLAQYCQLGKAAQLGLDGHSYHGVCSPAIDNEFRRRHAVGWELNQARTALRNVDSRQRDLEQKLSKAAEEKDKQRLRDEIRDLDREVRRARERVRMAEVDFDRFR
jgi:hypothetical protein